jgi:hypothetical protein
MTPPLLVVTNPVMAGGVAATVSVPVIQLQGYSPEALASKMYTNVISGFASFDIVEKLSPSEIVKRNSFTDQLKEYQQRINNLSRSNAIPTMATQTNMLP